jgi:hypothetical protein
MMNLMKQVTAVAAAATLLAVVAVPHAASAQSSTSQAYTTALVQVEPVSAPGEFDGRLKLTVTSDGIVNGYYFPAMGAGSIVPVVVGVQDGKYWMDIGGNTRLHIYAHLDKNGSLVGTATPTPYSLNMSHENLAETYSFVAKPVSN